MTRRWAVGGGVAAAVLVSSAGAVAIASPWNDEADESAPVASQAAITAQARWGEGYGSAQRRGQGQGQDQGQGKGHGHGGQRGVSGQQRGYGSGEQSHDPAANLPASGQISDATEQELLYMAEEEKLAHDLYVALGEQFDARQLDNIARAETKHLDAVRVLLDRYDLDDPTVDMQPGQFVDADLQALYDDLLESGSQSIADVAQAGITVEETDIADLTAALEATDAADVHQVFSSLRDGSQKHLAAFERLADRV